MHFYQRAASGQLVDVKRAAQANDKTRIENEQ